MADKVPPPPPPPPKGKAPPPPPPPKGKAPPPPPAPPKKAIQSSESDIRKQIAKAVENEDFELAANLKKKLPKPKQPKKKPKPKKAPPPPPAPPKPEAKKAKAPDKKRPRGPPPKGKRPTGKPPKGAPKGRPKKAPKGKKKRRLRIKLGLRESNLSENDDLYTDQVGWTVGENTLEELESEKPKGPEIVSHQCSMCGSMMQIPKPKRDRYKVVCAYPECGHADMIGL